MAGLNKDVPTSAERILAEKTTSAAMIMGWEKAIQKNAYENNILERELREILDKALKYDEKADPSGRIENIQDWASEKRGRSRLASPRLRAV